MYYNYSYFTSEINIFYSMNETHTANTNTVIAFTIFIAGLFNSTIYVRAIYVRVVIISLIANDECGYVCHRKCRT